MVQVYSSLLFCYFFYFSNSFFVFLITCLIFCSYECLSVSSSPVSLYPCLYIKLVLNLPLSAKQHGFATLVSPSCHTYPSRTNVFYEGQRKSSESIGSDLFMGCFHQKMDPSVMENMFGKLCSVLGSKSSFY